MSHPASHTARLQKAFIPDARGVVGVVDELLNVCRAHALRLEWADGTCLVRPLRSKFNLFRRLFAWHPDAASLRLFSAPMPKSVFRAILARLAALCNEHAPGSVSPYGGRGEVVIEGDEPAAFAVVFTNTPNEQRAEVRPTRVRVSPVPA